MHVDNRSIESGSLRGLAAVLLLCALTACSSAAENSGGATRSPEPKPVRIAAVKRNDAAREFSLTGVTRAASRAQLAFQVSGRLAERPVNIGSDVAKSDLVARLIQPGLEPAAEAARASVARLITQKAQAQRDLDRVRELVGKDAATRQELENARARRDTLNSQLSEARARSEQAASQAGEQRLEAPLAGTVEQVNFEPGEFVPAGRPVVSLSGARNLEVQIGIPERLLTTVAPGDTATLSLPFFEDREVSGTITQLASAAQGPGQLFSAVITLADDADLRPGLSVNWRLESPPDDRLMIPASAVASPGGTNAPRVYRVEDGVAQAVDVTLGEIVGENVLVTGDLTVGDAIVTTGLSNLSDGREVRVLE